jgi:hypothetical protein
MNKLLPDNWARERYALLTTALGGEPEGGNAKATLARLCAWTARDDIEILCALIRHQVHEAVDRFKLVVEEIAPIVRASNEVSDSGDVVIVISADLARSIIRAAGRRS